MFSGNHIFHNETVLVHLRVVEAPVIDLVALDIAQGHPEALTFLYHISLNPVCPGHAIANDRHVTVAFAPDLFHDVNVLFNVRSSSPSSTRAKFIYKNFKSSL